MTKSIPTIGPDAFQFVNLNEDSSELQIAGRPVGWIQWGTRRFDVSCGTPAQRAEVRELHGSDPNSDLGAFGTLGADSPAWCLAVRYALSLKEGELDLATAPAFLQVAAREALLLFFWGGVVCEDSSRSTLNLNAESEQTEPSSTPVSG